MLFEPRYELANMVGSNLMIGQNYLWLGTARGTSHRPYDGEELAVLATVMVSALVVRARGVSGRANDGSQGRS